MSNKEIILRRGNILLRPYIDADLSVIWAICSQNAWLHTQIPSLAQFMQQFPEWLASLEQLFIISSLAENECLGIAYIDQSSSNDGFAFFSIFLEQDHTNRGIGVISTALFFDYTFNRFTFRKLYGDIPAWNTASLRLAQGVGGIEEGCFKQHLWYHGRYWDVYRMALYRQRWHETRERFDRQKTRKDNNYE